MLDQIEQIARQILDSNPDAVVRRRLLRDVLGLPVDGSALENSLRVRELAQEQRQDGSWGRFHSQDSRLKQEILTTEMGVERALALGLEASHPILQKAAAYIFRVMRGVVPFPDPPEKNDRWATGERLFLASTLASIAPDHPELDRDRELWLNILEKTFRSGEYRAEDEIEAHRMLTGATVEGSYLVLRGKYQLNILGSTALPPDLERSLLAWLWSLPEGIGYLSVPLARPQRPGPGGMDRWLASHELLAQNFPAWRQFAGPVAAWLWEQRDPDGCWDFGPQPHASARLPLSDTWKSSRNRKFDWTVRVLGLLREFENSP